MSEQSENKENFKEKYKDKGAQKMSLAEYEALQNKKAKKPKIAVPRFVQIILSTPLLIIFVLGILIIPYILFLIITGPRVPIEEKEPKNSTTSTASQPATSRTK